ncbi:ABC transporter permease [Limnochorda pilosa]|uniref:ABC transporter substrate-binding protein n=1 Tax=Limnochorda pilosa TaxID=1555112 RepID=A0A0K2SKS1_LIMPI|nr:ABC transporter permease [Limnochorda pilosa]BAS27685.1 ABC transporter substrate-binding protein [Limnochorda pilosa]
MFQYITRRLLYIIPMLIGISILSFFIMQLAPGSFLDQFRMSPQIRPETLEAMARQFGLDKPPLVQYFVWLKNAVFHGDMGRSFSYNAPVTFLIGARALNTIVLTMSASLFAWLLALPIGIYSAVRQYSPGDRAFSFLSYIGLSIPNFFLALILLYLVVVYRLPFPVGGATSIEYAWMSWSERLADRLHHLIIPVVVLGTSQMAAVSRYMRAQLLDQLHQDFVRTARSKGLSERAVIYKHAVRNALNPLITLFGFDLGTILSGAALTEQVTNYPGLGKLILSAVLSRDYWLVMGSLMIGGALLVLGNLVADVLLALADPRIRYD